MKTVAALIILLTVHLLILINLQFTAWPEMLSYPYLRNNGFLIYKDMIHPYPPLLTIGLSWRYTLFGYDLWSLKAVAWGVILINGVLIWLITKHLTKENKYAFISLGLYIFLQPFLEGNMLWFDLAIIPPLLLSLLFLLRGNIFLTGLFLAAAMLIKQTTGLYFVFCILYFVFVKKTSFGELKKILYGPLLLGISLLVRLIQEGAFVDFVNWVLLYPLTKWGSIIGYVQMEMSLKQIMVIFLLIFPVIFFMPLLWKDKNLKLILLFLLGALIAVYPRFSFFHFQTALALVAILYGYLFSKMKFNLLLVICYLLLVTFLIHQPVLIRDFQKEARFYGEEEIQLAQVIASQVSKDEKVYLLGLPSNLYVMADRLPPKKWTDNFAWYLEIPGVQEEIISRWNVDPPKYIFWKTPSSGKEFDLGIYQPKKIVQWIENNYSKREEAVPGVWLWQVKKDLP